MGHKKVCLKCKLALNRDFDDGSEKRQYPCPECGNEMILLPHRFRPPKRTDVKKWQTVEFYIQSGFYYQHIYDTIDGGHQINGTEKYVEYPENLREAKEFLSKYINQSIRK
jgi:predicted RNA-binding Zn-ribbon protein involved in translation (DUF1610 family)